MKATLPAKLSRNYSVQIGSDSCTVRGFEIEPIGALFADATQQFPLDRAMPEPGSPWTDVADSEEMVAETMIAPPPVRKRSRPIASRAILLGLVDRD